VNERRVLTRRRFVAGAGGLAASAIAAGTAAAAQRSPLLNRIAERDGHRVGLPRALTLPARQFAWDATLTRDQYGNGVPPRFQQLLLFDVAEGPVTPEHARVLEAALRRLEHRYKWGPSGLLFTVGWSPAYFKKILHTAPPIPRAKALSDFEEPTIDDYHVCLHLACDSQSQLQTAADTTIRAVASVLTLRGRRSGFIGAGLPAAHQHTGGIPADKPIAKEAPLFMGFKSSLKKNQASEDSIAITEGPYADGTTMAVSHMRLALDSWYGDLSERERVARMYSPQTTPAAVAKLTTDAQSEPDKLGQAIRHHGVIGHAQTAARARRHGKPVILRRDFDTVDGGRAGLHFVSLQQSIADFVRTRQAMNASDVQLQNPGITSTVNNGINEYIFVLRRANYVIPPRSERSFPQLPGRLHAL
jgi:hypothetical protein